MTEPAQPPEQPLKKPKKEQPSEKPKNDEEALIFTPISIARARHASTHGSSVLDEKNLAKKAKPGQGKKPKSTASPSAVQSGLSLLSGPSGCLVLSFLVAAFVVGGILGGMAGGGLLLWANTSGTFVFADDTPTPTATLLPTAVAAATPTATSTTAPVATASIEDILAEVIPSVVTVINQHHTDFSSSSIVDEGRVVGSGVIIDARGYIATNNHVVDTPQDLKVILADGRELPAELVAANPAEDLAILRIEIADLPIIKWGDSGQVRTGQMVYAIGSPLGDFPNSVSFGIVSGLNRALEIDKYVIDGLIQTDAAINRGSSGGPLINLEGEVIGINTFIIRESEERGIAEGIAFAIPVDTAKSLLIPWIAAHTGESVPIPAAEGND